MHLRQPAIAILALAEACIPAHEAHSPVLHEEMCGMAEGAGITLAEAIVVGGFTDFVDTVRSHVAGSHPAAVVEDDCTAFIVPDSRADGVGLYAQTWDMHDSATEHVVLFRVRPDDGPAALVFSTTGCLGQIGMNEAGVCVGINNLTGIDGTTGVTWPTVVRDALLRSTADEALEVVKVRGQHRDTVSQVGLVGQPLGFAGIVDTVDSRCGLRGSDGRDAFIDLGFEDIGIPERGDVDGALETASNRIKGRIAVGGQDHMYLEGHIALAEREKIFPPNHFP